MGASSGEKLEPDHSCDLTVPSDDSRWTVIHVRPRCEKKICRFCNDNGLPVYLPLKREIRHYGSRERVFYNTLFPGYVFCVARPEQMLKLKNSGYVANLLPVLKQEQLVKELQYIQCALKAEKVVEVFPYLRTGSSIRIKAGPFKGFEGFVERIKGNTRIVINITMINQSMAVEIDAAQLAPF